MAIHFDTQGPAPDGFHVPLQSEWGGVQTIMNGLGLNTGDNWRINLHMPFAGRRFNDAVLRAQGSDGYYWSSTSYGNLLPSDARNLHISSSEVRSDYNSTHAMGINVRCFKDSFVVPTSSWTVINGTLGGAGIFRNQTEGLISITSNGTTGYTIQDKNLGATTVYNNGDTLTQANIGNMYQWGNNYGFPSTGSITTTSSTQVDASNYGPGNYYSSNIFITGNYERSSVRNDNLRGGVTQGIWVDYSVYDRETGQTLIYQGECSETDTIGDALSDVLTPNYGITNISESLGGESLGDSVLIKNTSGIFYDVSVTPGCHLRKDYSAMQGPAPDGFHVPTKDEWVAVYNAGVSLGAWTSSGGNNIKNYLKLPLAGNRARLTSDVSSQGSDGYYWSSTRSSENGAYNLTFSSSNINPQNGYYRSGAVSVRCFRNSPAIPNSSWTKLYGTSIEAGGIFWNSTDGLISLSSNGSTWITIADKNLGATTVWNNGDTLSEANCGKYYQWGNNYGFPRTGSVTTSSTQVDASTYGPGNYYSSSTFITRSSSPYRWDTTDNGNLWGGVTGVTYTEICPTYKLHGHIGTWHMESVKDYSAMQGPCPDGFHVPLSSEWSAVHNIWTALGGGDFGIALKLPLAGQRHYSSASVDYVGSNGYYWSSSRSNTNSAYFLYFNSFQLNPQNANNRAYGFSVRCFKNSPTVPTSSWTKLYGTSIESGGIFWSSIDGLISLSSNGTTWITIQDKNLGATTVWNSGDTLTDANCGCFYQWGNNYGFSHSGSVTTSSTQVDASTYGPGNYYSSSTFIKYTGRWDSTDNGNLWGGVTGVVTHYIPRS